MKPDYKDYPEPGPEDREAAIIYLIMAGLALGFLLAGWGLAG
jgi:hypothetical protein